MVRTAALYSRVSTLEQNCELQLGELRRYSGQRFSCTREYVDQGVSGTQRRRPAFDNLMRDALEEFRALGIDFISLTEGIDTTTPTGQLLFSILGAVAQFERDLIVERVRAGIAHARRQGKQIGRPRVLVDAEPIIRLRNEEMSLRQIARTLGIPVSRARRALARNTEARAEQQPTTAIAPLADE